ncbi:MAG: hypothetical protein P8Y64_03520 [Gammaproteobacteria bacterium]
MIKRLKMLVTGLVIGLLLGLWFGVNYGRGEPIYANPFKRHTLKGDLQDTLHDVKRNLRDSLK